ncbi:MAG TPA: hypothetical protein VGI19_04130 [Candidatus Cybelea sp.]|jgi:hypothetical protein
MKFAPALSLVAAAVILGGCLPTGSTTGVGALPEAGSALARATAQTSGDMLYVSGSRDSQLLTYPAGKLLATFGHGENALCSDKDGDIYMTGFRGVQVYKHGATSPYRTLTVPYDFVEDCSVDPTSGDLAVAVNCLSCQLGQPVTSLAIFHHARGNPKPYAAGLLGQHCGYDNAGNLFLSGLSNGAQFVELRKGSKTFTPISFNPAIPTDGHIQWDGHYLAIENVGGYGAQPAIYQVTISGSTGTVVGTTHLNGAYNALNAWIEGKRVIVAFIAAYYGVSRIGYWQYPEGGSLEKVLPDRRYRFHGVTGVTVSVAPNRR